MPRARYALIIFAALAVAGCAEPTTKSPYSGQNVDGPTLAIEARNEAQRVKDEAEADAEAQRLKLAAARRAFDSAAAGVEEGAAAELRRLADEHEQQASAAAAAIGQIAAKAQRGISLIETKHAAAAAAIERERARQNALFDGFQTITGSPLVQTASNGIPGGPLALGLLTLAGGWFARSRVHKAADSSWDEAKEETRAEALSKELAALKDSIAALKPPTPAPAPAPGGTV